MSGLPPSPTVPAFDKMMVPTLEALEQLGGSATIDELFQKVSEILRLPDDVVQVPHLDTAGSDVEYRLAWARTYLRKAGRIENSSRGVWALTASAGQRSLNITA